MRQMLAVALLALAVLSLALGCRSPKKVLTERDKQQVSDSVLPQAPAGEGIVAVNANFENKVKLLSYSVNRTQLKPGETAALTLYWECLAEVGGDFKIFVHLDSAKARKTFDHYAVGGLYPTSNWKAGEIVKDELSVALDASYPSGPARLWIGFFDAGAWKREQKNVRLAVKEAGAARSDGSDRLLVTTFLVGEVEEKRLAVARAVEPPQIDGRPDEAQWAAAFAAAGPLVALDGKALPEGEKGEVALLWDEAHLYLAFRIQDKDLQSPYTERDSTLWSGGKRGSSDVVEFFFDPDGDGKDYLELQLSPGGVVFDALFSTHRKPEWKEACKVNLEFSHKVAADGLLNDRVPDRGYFAEVAIPWAQLPGMAGPPTPERKFRANFYRLSNSGVWAGAWVPVGNDFHELSVAGLVTFAR